MSSLTAGGLHIPRLRHVAQYLTFVGVPLLGLLGVLRVGRDLRAPMAVRGSYMVDTVAGPVTGCFRELAADSTLVVAQSGTRIEVRLAQGAVRLEGDLTADRFAAAGVLPAIPGCSAGAPLRLEGFATRTGRQMRLMVELQAKCLGCGTVTLGAWRPDRPRVSDP